LSINRRFPLRRGAERNGVLREATEGKKGNVQTWLAAKLGEGGVLRKDLSTTHHVVRLEWGNLKGKQTKKRERGPLRYRISLAKGDGKEEKRVSIGNGGRGDGEVAVNFLWEREEKLWG